MAGLSAEKRKLTVEDSRSLESDFVLFHAGRSGSVVFPPMSASTQRDEVSVCLPPLRKRKKKKRTVHSQTLSPFLRVFFLPTCGTTPFFFFELFRTCLKSVVFLLFIALRIQTSKRIGTYLLFNTCSALSCFFFYFLFLCYIHASALLCHKHTHNTKKKVNRDSLKVGKEHDASDLPISLIIHAVCSLLFLLFMLMR